MIDCWPSSGYEALFIDNNKSTDLHTPGIEPVPCIGGGDICRDTPDTPDAAIAGETVDPAAVVTPLGAANEDQMLEPTAAAGEVPTAANDADVELQRMTPYCDSHLSMSPRFVSHRNPCGVSLATSNEEQVLGDPLI